MAVTAGCCGGGDSFTCDQLGGCSITDLGDVDTTTTPPQPGDVLTQDENGQWVPGAPPSGGTSYAPGACVDFTSINPGGPVNISVRVDPATDNQLACGPDGLYVPPTSGTAVDGAESDTASTTVTPPANPGDPYVVETDVKLSTDPGNQVQQGSDGALFVPPWDCTQLNGCSIDELADTDTTTTPPADGQVLTWDDTSGQWVPADPATGTATVVQGADTDTVDTEVVEGPAGTFTVSSEVNLSQDSGNQIVQGSDGGLMVPEWDCTQLAACSIDALADVDTTTNPPAPGDVLTQDSNGQWVPGPAPAPSLTTGCGVTGAGSAADPLTANTSGLWGSGPLALPCDDTNGQVVYCDSNGQLRSEPPRYTVQAIGQHQQGQNIPPGTPGTASPILLDASLELTNPSDCREMDIKMEFRSDCVQFVQSPGNDWVYQVGVAYTVDGADPAQPTPSIGWQRNRHHADTPGQSVHRYSPGSALWPGLIRIPPGGVFKARMTTRVFWYESNPNSWTETAMDPDPVLQIDNITLFAIGTNL